MSIYILVWKAQSVNTSHLHQSFHSTHNLWTWSRSCDHYPLLIVWHLNNWLHTHFFGEIDGRNIRFVRRIFTDAAISSTSVQCLKPILRIHTTNSVSGDMNRTACPDHVMNNPCCIAYFIIAKTFSRKNRLFCNVFSFSRKAIFCLELVSCVDINQRVFRDIYYIISFLSHRTWWLSQITW